MDIGGTLHQFRSLEKKAAGQIAQFRETVSPIWKSTIDLHENSKISACFLRGESEPLKSDALSPLGTPRLLGAAIEEWVTTLTKKHPFGQRHNVYFMLFALSAMLSSYARTVGVDASFLSGLAALFGSVTCGWAWLFVRSLFTPSHEDSAAPLMVVLFIFTLQFAGAAGVALHGGEVNLLRMTDKIVGMVGSTFIIVTLAEIARHIPGTQKGPERRFRQLFTVGYFALIVVAVFMVEGANEGSYFSTHTKTIQSIAALTALAGALVALRFRHRHPLTHRPVADRTARPSASPTARDKRLARRVEELVNKPEVYTQPSLKVADVAAQLGEHDYLVSKAITQVLGQSNFNRYINRFRVEQAQRMLSDPGLSGSSILVIALDCGFASIGPFNRAFREETGMSPSAYRLQSARSR
ncbi:helix-turn-helix transcriptional regulator [Sphingorhabdus sp. Alg231-15]|uniref:helix-turn-helix transcriptional regulator n=1 Tax=Sphingorhabdus sp. Alg231-15 TaxID=1922222 RepID=UPI00307BCFCD